jgi:molybdenum cofactor cytidylyltransferase
MGRCKPLLPLGDEPVACRCVRALKEGGIDAIVAVVAPPHGDRVAAALAPLGVRLVRNDDPGSDMAGSVRAGLAAVDGDASAVVVCPADHPLVSPSTVAALLAAHAAEPDRIVIPAHAGRKGHPVLFPRAILDELAALPTLRDVVRRDPGRLRLLEVADPGILLDLDTPADYARAKAIIEKIR